MAREHAGFTLSATALVHEAWLRLEKSSLLEWRDRRQFFAAAAEAMHRILVEAARRRIAAKRGDGAEKLSVDEIEIPVSMTDERLLRSAKPLIALKSKTPPKHLS